MNELKFWPDKKCATVFEKYSTTSHLDCVGYPQQQIWRQFASLLLVFVSSS